jgi:hypothetical protein
LSYLLSGSSIQPGAEPDDYLLSQIKIIKLMYVGLNVWLSAIRDPPAKVRQKVKKGLDKLD